MPSQGTSNRYASRFFRTACTDTSRLLLLLLLLQSRGVILLLLAIHKGLLLDSKGLLVAGNLVLGLRPAQGFRAIPMFGQVLVIAKGPTGVVEQLGRQQVLPAMLTNFCGP